MHKDPSFLPKIDNLLFFQSMPIFFKSYWHKVSSTVPLDYRQHSYPFLISTD